MTSNICWGIFQKIGNEIYALCGKYDPTPEWKNLKDPTLKYFISPFFSPVSAALYVERNNISNYSINKFQVGVDINIEDVLSAFK